MLLSFRVSNYRCFADDVELSFLSPRLKTNVPRGGKGWSEVTRRVAALYGPNAAGKSTVLDAVHALTAAIREPGVPGLHQPYGRQTASGPTRYAVDFVTKTEDGPTRFEYEVVAERWGIRREELASYPKGTRRLVFRREQDGKDAELVLEKGSTLVGPTQEVRRITTPRMLFLATALKYDHSGLIAPARALGEELGSHFVTFRDRVDEQVLRRVVMEMVNAPATQVELVDALLHTADLGVAGVQLRQEKIPAEVREKIAQLLSVLSDGGTEADEEVPELRDVITFTHNGPDGQTFELPVAGESAGTITWLNIAWQALSALKAGAFLAVDELDASLHPELARFLVSLFQSTRLNPHGAQMVFTTHDVSLLGNAPQRLLEPADVWFVEKGRDGIADLYSLAHFDNRPGNNSQKRYLAGQFGAVPDIDETLILHYLNDDPPLAHVG